VGGIRDDGAGGLVVVSLGQTAHFSGGNWALEPTLTFDALTSLWLGPDGSGWAVGPGMILRRRP
jgi:hypothetical protein